MLTTSRIRLAAMLSLIIGLLGIPTAAAPGGAQQNNNQGPSVESEGDDVVARVQAEMERLRSGSSGGSYTPPSCSWEDQHGEVHDDGVLQWRLTQLTQESWAETREEDLDEGTFYRYECWAEGMCAPGESHDGYDHEGVCYGKLVGQSGPDVDTFCGSGICFFAVTPETMAMVMLEEAVETLPTPVARFSPPNERTIVNFDTWLWVEDAPETRIELDPVSVPDQSVLAWATFDEVEWDMGDGSDPFSCPLTTDAESAQQHDCSIYRYERTSAGEPEDRFHGTVSIEWQVEWEGVQAGEEVSGDFPELRESEFSLEVAEGQAVVVDR